MVAFLGGFRIFDAGWAGRRAVFVDFDTTYTDRLYQLYAGRNLIGVTRVIGERRVIGQLQPTTSPAQLTLLAVLPADQQTDFGPKLPKFPWNRYQLDWEAAAYPVDADHFEITAGTTPGGAVDSNNVVARVPFVGDGSYVYVLPALSESGEWNYEITPRDDARPSGNAGTPATAQITALIPPPDLQIDSDGNRFNVSIVSGVATVTFNY